ncbi:hypothetical protein COCNU_07G007240 [Cocos nucifera]|uniref:C3H1-type domain-containing protein n=1 Tax=Cocos nucifera TaxID=13894 RepID=A0A8K0IFB4_COCNU|nr:hypothetical protein COCNU_07G007240 [Cocos nucifera]
MDNETADRYGNKRVHQRVGSSAAAAAVPDRVNQVCYHWRAGRCNYHPCSFLHSELPAQPDGPAAKRTHHQALLFGERGKIFSKEEMRAIQIGPGGLFFTGEGTGELKVWKWLTNETPT